MEKDAPTTTPKLDEIKNDSNGNDAIVKESIAVESKKSSHSELPVDKQGSDPTVSSSSTKPEVEAKVEAVTKVDTKVDAALSTASETKIDDSSSNKGPVVPEVDKIKDDDRGNDQVTLDEHRPHKALIPTAIVTETSAAAEIPTVAASAAVATPAAATSTTILPPSGSTAIPDTGSTATLTAVPIPTLQQTPVPTPTLQQTVFPTIAQQQQQKQLLEKAKAPPPDPAPVAPVAATTTAAASATATTSSKPVTTTTALAVPVGTAGVSSTVPAPVPVASAPKQPPPSTVASGAATTATSTAATTLPTAAAASITTTLPITTTSPLPSTSTTTPLPNTSAITTATPLTHPAGLVLTDAAHALSNAAAAHALGGGVEGEADQETAAEQEMRRLRTPLTDLYAPFVISSDTSLVTARDRLEKALEQTRVLRAAFTERVYGKYRVCLDRPLSHEETLQRIRKEPVTVHKRLTEQIAATKEEKEIEKKEAQKLNAEMAAANSAAAFNVDNAEQLMFLSAGLNLVILPELQVDPQTVRGYKERGPVNPETGQRVRAISQAAATAGEVMLDRTRKAAAMRVERQRRRQLQLLSGETPEADASNSYSRLQLLSQTTTTTTTAAAAGRSNTASLFPSVAAAPVAAAASTMPPPATITIPSTKVSKKTAASAATVKPTPTSSGSGSHQGSSGSKSSRSRGTAALSANTLLSLNPNADEINTDGKPCAATAALISRGVGATANNKSTQQRLRHPHPESLGGRRRATSNPAVKHKEASSSASTLASFQHPPEPFLQSYLALTLPPVPATKERLERKPLPVCTPEEASTKRARESVRGVLEQFVSPVDKEGQGGLCDVTKIRLLYGLRKLNQDAANDAKVDAATADSKLAMPSQPQPSTLPAMYPAGIASSGTPNPEAPMDPILTFSVLHAIGLIARSTTTTATGKRPISELTLPSIDEKNGASAKLMELRRKLSAESDACTLTDRLLSGDEDQTTARPNKRARAESADAAVTEPTPMEEDVDPTPAVSKASFSPEVASIRGGGGGILTTDDNNTSDERMAHDRAPEVSSDEPGGSEVKSGNQRLPNSPGRNTAVRPQYQTSAAQLQQADTARMAYANAQMNAPSAARLQGYGATQADLQHHHDQTYNAFHLAQQLRQLHHPAGDLADYIGNLQQQQRQTGYDFSSLIPGAGMSAAQAQSSLAALGLHGSGLVGYSMQDRAATARAMFARDQQAVALLGGNHGYPQSTSQYSNVNAHAAAVSAMLGSSAQNAMLGHQYSVASPVPQMPASMFQQAVQSTPSEAVARDNGESKPHRDTGPAKSSKKAEKVKPVRLEDAASDKKPAQAASRTLTMKSSPAVSLVKAPVDTAEKEKAKVSDKGASERKAPSPKAESDSSDRDDQNTSTTVDEHGMKLFAPKTPSCVSFEHASLIRSGKFHEVAPALLDKSKRSGALEYLISVGAAVPIPKALVAGPLKERLNTPGFKNAGSIGAPAIPRDVVIANILVWLWAQHEHNFQQAFEKSGRIDVDPDCKWLIQAAVDTSVRELTLEIADAVARGEGPFADALATRKGHSSSKNPSAVSETERTNASKRVEVHTASAVSKALMTELRVDGEMNSMMPKFQHLVEYLDESRMCALRAKSQERTLLATLIAQKTTMVEPFSHAYVSAMVRAGEALGHGKLFETVQDEDVMASSMMPYDIFTDESGLWEDPGKPEEYFTHGLSGDDLVRRAHARAMLRKSLRKLQDRHSIRGGTPAYGPYVDASTAQSSAASAGASEHGKTQQAATAPRSGFKRRAYSISEPPVPPGTGSAHAKSSIVYNPNHVSAPLEWDADDLENSIYGRYARDRVRSLSMSLSRVDPRGGKKTKRSMSMSAESTISAGLDSTDGEAPNLRSTREIEWVDVAGIFQNVELPKKSKASAEEKPAARTIIAPFCRLIDTEPVAEDESDTEEDLSDETVLKNHQIVLDEMKAQLSTYLETRKEQQERRKNKSKG